MIDTPEDIFVLTAMEGEYCQGIIIAYIEVNEQGKVQCFVWQNGLFSKPAHRRQISALQRIHPELE
jgi:hypothetical protein